jgi:hypothetical protein
VPPNDLTRPLVRVGWAAGSRAVTPYELDTANEPDLEITCVTARGTSSRDEEPPPLPSRPEPTPEVLAAVREARAAAAADSRRSSRRAGAWR